jgi:hypothetical protein
MAYAINPWQPNPIQLNYAPASTVFAKSIQVSVINGFLVGEAAYRTNYQGEVNQPSSVDQFVFDFFGNPVSSGPNTLGELKSLCCQRTSCNSGTGRRADALRVRTNALTYLCAAAGRAMGE